jgi:hypothetical protein
MLDVVNQFTFENFTKEVYKVLNNYFPIHALQKKSTTLVNTFETSDRLHTLMTFILSVLRFTDSDFPFLKSTWVHRHFFGVVRVTHIVKSRKFYKTNERKHEPRDYLCLDVVFMKYI